MNDVEISRDLARAIGWKNEDCFVDFDTVRCWDNTAKKWRKFDYRYWSVIGPIAEHYDCFPERSLNGVAWVAKWPYSNKIKVAETPQKAIAILVIEALKCAPVTQSKSTTK